MSRGVQGYPGDMRPFQMMGPSGNGLSPYMMPIMPSQMYSSSSQFSQVSDYQLQSHGMIQNQIGNRQMYDQQMEQYLNEQRMQIQQQLEKRMMVQRKIDQHKQDQLEVAAVKAKLGDDICDLQNFPFKIIPNAHGPQHYGVVKICNLPYAVTRHEIHQLLGRHAGILGAELGGGIHIIMERSTAKTMDAFIEFKSQKDAEITVHRLSFTESGRYARLGTRHVDITLSSEDELLQNIFPRAKCIEWRNGVPKLLPNTDPYSAGFQGFLTSEEIRGLIAHALNPARSPFTERCRQRTYECLISTLWKFPWFATTMYTIGDRDELFQAAMQQVLELSDKIKQRRFIGLNESLLVDVLRAGVNCPAFNERQKICLYAAAEMPTFSPIVHSKYFEYWPFDCLAKDDLATEYEVMFYAQQIRSGLSACRKDDIAVPNSWRNREGLTTESPWGHLWIEWGLHDKITTFEAAANLEVQLASDLLKLATSIEHQHGNQKNDLSTGLVVSSRFAPLQQIIRSNAQPLPDPWAVKATKREALNYETPSRQSRENNPSGYEVSDDDSLTLAFASVRLGSGASSTYSGGLSHVGSTSGSMTTNEGDNNGVSQETWAAKEGKIRTRHQHSQSLSAIASAAIPPANHQRSQDAASFRRRGTVSIPPTIHSTSGYSDKGEDQYSMPIRGDVLPQASAYFAPGTSATQVANREDNCIDVNTLMTRHGIWSKSPSQSHHTSNASLGSQPCVLTVVSEDEEDVFNKATH